MHGIAVIQIQVDDKSLAIRSRSPQAMKRSVPVKNLEFHAWNDVSVLISLGDHERAIG